LLFGVEIGGGESKDLLLFFASYSGFDSALYRNVDAKGHFSQENGPSHDLQMEALESKPL